jgi:hypothetical protein
VTENRSVTVSNLIEQLINMRDGQGWGDVEVAIDDGHGCCGFLCLLDSATYYPSAAIQLDGKPSARPVVILRTEGGWQ